MPLPITIPSGAPSRPVALAVAFATVALPAVAAGGAAAAGPALGWDLLFLACYGAGLWLGTVAASWVAWTPRVAAAARFGRTATVLTVLAGTLQSLLPGHAAAAAATVKYSAALSATLIAGCGATILAWRCAAHSARRLARRAAKDLDAVPPRPLEPDDPLAPSPERSTPDAEATRWRNAYTVPGVDPAEVNARWARGEHTTGCCLSGGGIRAAAVAMGALQSLRGELLGADHLVSVSGGGYTAGALQQALTGASPPGGPPVRGEVLRDPESAYREGSAELHHIRRHSSYLADTPGQLLAALGRVARGLVLSLALLFGPAIALGVAAGWLYRHVPFTDPALGPLAFPVPRPATLAALGVVAVAAFLLALFAAGAAAERPRSARLARQLATLAGLTAVLTLAVPALGWLAGWLLARTGQGVEIAGPVGTVLLTFAATLASIAWRHRGALGRRLSGLTRSRRDGAVPAALPNGVLQRLLVIGTLGVLAGAWLLVFAGSATTRGAPAALVTGALVLAVLVVLGALFDVTSLSLHPFFRQRLAAAFAVRAVRRAGDGQVVAVPYEPAERTTLSSYGRVAEGVRFPRLVFAAAANLTGEGRTAPGLNAVSYTMSADWTGGPDVGWVRTRDLEGSVPPRFRRDLTVQGAVAVSGAAFASAMGRASRWYQVLFAVSGARLGAWLPNPGFLRRAHEAAGRGHWTHPWLPRARRLPYLWREVFGSHPHRDPLLHVTDGGHYDNLGLVELLRRRCTRIFCVDATGDAPPSATALAQALTLAHQELGVRVELDEPWLAEPGTGQPWEGGHPLNSRLSQSPVLTGTIVYPPESGLDAEIRGRLVVAKALLWRDLPYPLLSYAARHPEFPHDSTGDQWFGHEKFSAYTELGRHIGAAAREAADPLHVPLATPDDTEVVLTTDPS